MSSGDLFLSPRRCISEITRARIELVLRLGQTHATVYKYQTPPRGPYNVRHVKEINRTNVRCLILSAQLERQHGSSAARCGPRGEKRGAEDKRFTNTGELCRSFMPTVALLYLDITTRECGSGTPWSSREKSTQRVSHQNNAIS